MSEQPAKDIQPIENVNDLANKIIQWHAHRVARLQHMLEIPAGTEVDFEDGEKLVLEGAARSAFRLGIQVALKELGHLPIVAQYDTND